MEMIGDYTKNPFYHLEADEEFIIDHYRLIKRKKPNIAEYAIDPAEDGKYDLKQPSQ